MKAEQDVASDSCSWNLWLFLQSVQGVDTSKCESQMGVCVSCLGFPMFEKRHTHTQIAKLA